MTKPGRLGDGRVAVSEVVPIGGRGSSTISEVEIENVLTFESQIRGAVDSRDRIAASILDRLLEGADLDDTAHEVSFETVERHGVREECLYIDGVLRFRRLAGSSSKLKRRSATRKGG